MRERFKQFDEALVVKYLPICGRKPGKLDVVSRFEPMLIRRRIRQLGLQAAEARDAALSDEQSRRRAVGLGAAQQQTRNHPI